MESGLIYLFIYLSARSRRNAHGMRQDGRVHGRSTPLATDGSGAARATTPLLAHSNAPGLGATLLRLVRVLVVGVLLARLGPLARVLALVTPSARRLRTGTGSAHLLEADRPSSG